MAKSRKIPHTYVIVFYIIVVAAIVTWLVPGGSFERHKVEVNGIEREVIKNQSFQFGESHPQTWQVFSAIFDGFVDKADIIVFILLIGGAFWIMNESKAIDTGILSFLRWTKRIEHWRFLKFLGIENIIIALIMIVFSLFGAIFGMSEETIAFTIVFIPLAIRMGYDSIVGVAMCYVGAHIGFAGALLNPFTIGIAQGISNLPLFSGIEYRLFCWVVITITGIAFILWYANKVKKNPKASSVYEEDEYWRKAGSDESHEINTKAPLSAWITWGLLSSALMAYAVTYPISSLSIGNSTSNLPALPVLAALFLVSGFFALRKGVQFFILNLLMFTIFYLITGVMGYGWYVMEIATLFFVMGLASGISMGYSPNAITKSFLAGVNDILPAAMVVGLAGGIIIVLQNGGVIDTLLYYASSGMEETGKTGTIGIMYALQTGINIIIPSGSAKAALTMPIMSQFSDLVGLSRQATVMAFQFGDGFTNMITPTSGVLIGVLGIARIPYSKWVKWIFPFIIGLFILGFLLLLPTVFMNLNGF